MSPAGLSLDTTQQQLRQLEALPSLEEADVTHRGPQGHLGNVPCIFPSFSISCIAFLLTCHVAFFLPVPAKAGLADPRLGGYLNPQISCGPILNPNPVP